jgi:hypothetical protein
MSNTRIFWIAWCCMWALGWLLLGFFTIITWLFVPFSLLAILIPIGKGSTEHTVNINVNKQGSLPQGNGHVTPPVGNVRIDGPEYDAAYQAWLKNQGGQAS